MSRFFILIFLLPQLLHGGNALNSIKADFNSGKITYQEFLVNRALAIYNPVKLPPAYQKSEHLDLPLKSGTLIAADLKRNWDTFSNSNKRMLEKYLTRPDLPHSTISPSGQFKVHYTLTGSEAVSATDISPANGIPDYVDHVAESFDYSHKIQTEVLGFTPPPTDMGLGGGDEFDIYIRDFRSIYGQTFYEGAVSGKENAYYGYTEIDNDYYGFPTSGLDGMRVTSAHEYFHAIHFGYKFKPNNDAFWENEVFYYEISSTWMEDMVYNDINDYYFYLNRFFRDINMPFDTYNDSYEYGNCLFNHMLSKKYGPGIINKIWDRFRSVSVLEAIDATLREYGSNFDDEYLDYSIWNYFTGSRGDSVEYYDESLDYPEVTYKRIHEFRADTSIVGTIYQFSFAYYFIINSESGQASTFIPVNRENSEGMTSNFTLEMSRSNRNFFTQIESGFNARMFVDQLTRWRMLVATPDQNTGSHTISELYPVDPQLLKTKDLVIGMGPNPFKPKDHDTFSLFYQLKKNSPVTITIFNENGIKVKELSSPEKNAGLNSFEWDAGELGSFPGGSGIYMLFIRTNNEFDIIKFAVIK